MSGRSIVSRMLRGAVLVLMGSAHAQIAAIARPSDLVGKTFFLRPLCAGDNLSFTAEGKPVRECKPESFTVALLTIDKVEASSAGLQIRAHRGGLVFRDGTPQRVDLSHPVNGEPSHNVKLKIAAPGSGDFMTGLAAVFTDDFATLRTSVPDYWRPFFDARLTPGAQHPQPASRETSVDSQRDVSQEEIDAMQRNPGAIGDEASQADDGGRPQVVPPPAARGVAKAGRSGGAPPRVLQTRDAEFSQQARSMFYSGISRIGMVVNEQGQIAQLWIERPAGLGLDEQAIEAVRHYRFGPAMRDGHGVPVQMNVEVNFQIAP